MTLRDQTDSQKRIGLALQLKRADYERITELAAEAGMAKATLATALIEELLPTITTVRRRLQITRVEKNGGPPR